MAALPGIVSVNAFEIQTEDWHALMLLGEVNLNVHAEEKYMYRVSNEGKHILHYS